jgi:hypothetical protein
VISPDAPFGTFSPAPSSVAGSAQLLSEEVLRAAGLITESEPAVWPVWPGWANIVFYAVPDGAEAAALQTVLGEEDGPAKVHAAYALGDKRAVVDLIAGWATRDTP